MVLNIDPVRIVGNKSTEEALAEIEPIDLSPDVINGRGKIVIDDISFKGKEAIVRIVDESKG